MFYKVYGYNKYTQEECQHFYQAPDIDTALYDACIKQEGDGWLWRIEGEYPDPPTRTSLLEEYTQYLSTSEIHTGMWRGAERVLRWLKQNRYPRALEIVALSTRKKLQALLLVDDDDPELRKYVEKQLLVVSYFIEQVDHIQEY